MRKKFLLLFFCCLMGVAAFAQSTITGTVKGADGKPLAGATVLVQGTLIATQTNDQGVFTLRTSPESTLEFKYVGYENLVQALKGRTTIEITLKETYSTLDEVVLMGYQTVTRKKSTAAVSSISGKELENLPAASFDILMQGRLAGVSVQNITGAPGASPSVAVRGNSAVGANFLGNDDNQINAVSRPLYVIDGVPQPDDAYTSLNTGTGTNAIAGLAPGDIESIDVLRDAAAAALYGSRAANGVILITTKKGRSGSPRLRVEAYSGIVTRPELREVTLGTTERRQKMEMLATKLTNAQMANLPILLTDSLNPAYNGNTDWQDLFYRNGVTTNVNVSLEGGDSEGRSNYRFSGNYFEEEGIIKATGFDRLALRLNLGARAMNNRLNITPIVAFTRNNRSRGTGSSTNPISLGAGNMPTSLFEYSEARKKALLNRYDESLDFNVDNQLTLNLNTTLTILPNLTFTTQNSMMYNTSRRDQNRPRAMMNNQGNRSESFTSAVEDYRTSNFLNYSTNIGEKHSISALLGQEFQYNRYLTTNAGGQLGVSDAIKTVTGFLQQNIWAGSDYQTWAVSSLMASVNYDYAGKYLISGFVRGDGSSRFGENNKWGVFPSVSAGWLISEENFMKDKSAFTLLKLRGSYGVTGDQNGGNYLQYNLYQVNAGGYSGSNGSASYNGVSVIRPNFTDGVAQQNISWQNSEQWNIGVDVEIQNGRYSGFFDIFNRANNRMVFPVDLPTTSGYDYAQTNSIGVRNYGAETQLTANVFDRSRPVAWRILFNASYTRNQITELPNNNRDLILGGDFFDKRHILSVGAPLNSFYMLKTLGVYSTVNDVPTNPLTGERFRNPNGLYSAGDFIFEDVDGDYLIDIFKDGITPDKRPMGDPNPRWNGGLTNEIMWKRWSLIAQINYTLDRDILDQFTASQFANSQSGDALNEFVRHSTPNFDALNIWRKPGDQAEYAGVDLGSYRYYYTSAQSFFLEPGDYIRLRSLILNYNFKPELLRRIGMSELRLSLVADNLLRWQASKSVPDAENVTAAYGIYNGGGYPIPKKYTLSVNFTF
jgi:TonB-linked SusC/RagA family outer membrane protein